MSSILSGCDGLVEVVKKQSHYSICVGLDMTHNQDKVDTYSSGLVVLLPEGTASTRLRSNSADIFLDRSG